MKKFKNILVLSIFLSLTTLIGCDENVSNQSNNNNITNSENINQIPSDVISVEEALNLAKQLSSGQTSSKDYKVKGEVYDLYNATYGNCHLIDGKGNDITIYGMYNYDGTIRFDGMDKQPDVGDEIIVEGPLMNYYSSNKGTTTYEIVDARVLFINGINQAANSNNNNNNNNTSEDIKISYDENGWTYSGTYYSDLNSGLTGTNLLSKLRAINSTKKSRNYTYDDMWSLFPYTDYDPNNNGKYIAFYRGTTATRSQMNKEHVWPNSRGGNLIEGDVHVIRPTFTSDNSSRGNAFYVEGKTGGNNVGWDPKAVNMNEDYRGQAARIIFYGMVANSSLKLVDTNTDSTGNKSMGKLSDLLKWNLQYSVQPSEVRRNNGAETKQGNRNPFIDNPSFACSIWGNTNSNTKEICSATSASMYKQETITKKAKQKGISDYTANIDFIEISITTEPKKEEN